MSYKSKLLKICILLEIFKSKENSVSLRFFFLIHIHIFLHYNTRSIEVFIFFILNHHFLAFFPFLLIHTCIPTFIHPTKKIPPLQLTPFLTYLDTPFTPPIFWVKDNFFYVIFFYIFFFFAQSKSIFFFFYLLFDST